MLKGRRNRREIITTYNSMTESRKSFLMIILMMTMIPMNLIHMHLTWPTTLPLFLHWPTCMRGGVTTCQLILNSLTSFQDLNDRHQMQWAIDWWQLNQNENDVENDVNVILLTEAWIWSLNSRMPLSKSSGLLTTRIPLIGSDRMNELFSFPPYKWYIRRSKMTIIKKITD